MDVRKRQYDDALMVNMGSQYEERRQPLREKKELIKIEINN
jgi:hypothetical protein